MRIVLDSNILVRANPLAAPDGLARELLLVAASKPNLLLISDPILSEVERVLSYPHVQKRWPLSTRQIGDFIAALMAASTIVKLPSSFPAIVSDPDDDPILQTAILGEASVLCSRDDAFHHERVKAFCESHSLRILDDVALMQELRSLG